MTETAQNVPDFEILMPTTQLHPIIFNSPHSGDQYSTDFIAASRLKLLTLRNSEDSFVDQLFGAMPDLGCPLLRANFPRAYLDVNRAPWELDPKMFTDKLPAYAETKTLRVIGGLGTIARNVSENQKIYRKKLQFSEVKARVERYYFPYHQALKGLISNTVKQFDLSLLIDCHSMPSNAGRLLKSRNKSPDIILGDRYGTTCSAEFIDLLEGLFTSAGLNTIRNKPYAGGYITQTYGRPAQDCHALQIEINRGLYMNEKKITKSADFQALQQTLTEIFTDFLDAATPTGKQHSLAAE